MYMRWILVLFLALVGCASKPIVINTNSTGAPPPAPQVVPGTVSSEDTARRVNDVDALVAATDRANQCLVGLVLTHESVAKAMKCVAETTIAVDDNTHFQIQLILDALRGIKVRLDEQEERGVFTMRIGAGMLWYHARNASVFTAPGLSFPVGTRHLSFEIDGVAGYDFENSMFGGRAGLMVHTFPGDELSFGLRMNFLGWGIEDESSRGLYWFSILSPELAIRYRFADKRMKSGWFVEVFGGPGAGFFDSSRQARNGLHGGFGAFVGYEF
jgi:hypothetical protein